MIVISFLKKLLIGRQLPARLLPLKKHLKKRLKQLDQSPAQLSAADRQLAENINMLTKQHNRNNVTRTQAYLDFYLDYPEVHWAFLAHMVSRNAGWNMTDLKGEILPRLLTEKQRENYYSFLERGNWLIFQDAFPQLLLYKESRRQERSLFYLLPHFHVSAFMEVIWNDFYHGQQSDILTAALIINEQQYIEKRVIKHPIYQKNVFDSIEFLLQELLAFNQIIFPYQNGLAGSTMQSFEQLYARIHFGKKLYALLFFKPEVLEWAKAVPHTGSRKDYWPGIFHEIKEAAPGISYQLKLSNCQIRKGAARFYSPTLANAWPDSRQEPDSREDWFSDWKIIFLLFPIEGVEGGQIEEEYCSTLEKLELAAAAKKLILR